MPSLTELLSTIAEKQGEWRRVLEQGAFKFGHCNCDTCVVDITDTPEETVTKALLDMFGDAIIPHAYNPNWRFLQRGTAPTHLPFRTKRQWQAVLNSVVEIKKNVLVERYHNPDQWDDICPDCGLLFKVTQGKTNIHNEVVCHNCISQYYVECYHCGDLVQRRGTYEFDPTFSHETWNRQRTNDMRCLCKSCYEEHYIACSGCSMPLDREHWINVSLLMGFNEEEQEITIGVQAPQYDVNIGDFITDGDLHIINRPVKVMCPTCKNNYIRPCPRCGRDTYSNNMRSVVVDGRTEHVCLDCENDLVVIHRYDFVTEPKFLGSKNETIRPDGLHYGVEIEVEYPDEYQYNADTHETYRPEGKLTKDAVGKKIIDWWGKGEFVLKNDGSLDNGFEIVTHPFTWSHYLSNKNKWTDFLLYVQSLGLSATYSKPSMNGDHETCGFHVHLSKDAFSYMHLYKFVHFFYKASTRPLINGIADRQSSSFAKFISEDRDNLVKVSKNKCNVSHSRYSAINLMGGTRGRNNHPAKTVEARVFRGTIEPFVFHKNLEFCQSLFEFTACHSPKEMMVKKYLLHLMRKPNQWRSLLSYIQGNESINHAYSYVRKTLKGV